MPAEWEPHEATWLAWPHNPETWPGKMEPIPGIWVAMIRALSPGEKIHLCVNDAAMEREVSDLLMKADLTRNVALHQIPTNDCWARDHGPIFVIQKTEIAALKFRYNAWGGKYPPWDLDDAVAGKVAKVIGAPIIEAGIVLEGGSIDVNGLGTLLTTEQCLLNKNRNPHLTKKEIEVTLARYFGVTNIIWLGEGIVGDDTDGHIDDIARFVGPQSVLAAVEEDPTDENYKPLQENLKRLKAMKDQDGRPLKVIPLPMPGPVFYQNQRLPASYANFYIGNGAVLAPIFNQPNDQKSLAVLQKVFPRRRIVGIVATDLIWGLGAFHCVTQQQPAVA